MALDPKIIREMLKGYALGSDFIAAERKARLKTITVKESLEIFASLYQTWEQSGKLAGGDLSAIDQRRLNDHIKLRKAFEKLAKHQGLI